MSVPSTSALHMAIPPATPRLHIEPPDLRPEEALALATRCYGVTGKLADLDSERDRIFNLTTTDGISFVLRISHWGSSPAALEFQNDALSRLAAVDPELPVPRLRASVHNRTLETVLHGERRYAIRLFSFLHGERVEDVEPSSALYRDIGRTFAALDTVLRSLRRPPSDEAFLWNTHRVADLYPLAIHIEESAHRRMVEAVFERLHECTLARLGRLRSQVIHNDCNARNVLVDSANHERVCGILDFGDLTESALVVELGVAIARQARLDNALASACDLVEGYHGRMPLHEDEIDVLFDVVCTRLVMKAVIWSWRRSLGDPRYSGRMRDTFDLLALWLRHGRRQSTDAFRAACRRADVGRL